MTDTVSAELTERPKAPIEYRVAETLDVKFPQRLVTVLAMPYDTPTQRVVKDGRQITEICDRGAFGVYSMHRKDVRVYRDHDKTRTAGRAVALHPDADAGLVAELRMSKTPLGDETLELAEDRLIDASIGFAPIEARWTKDRQTRRLVRCYLDHIALVGDPAYEGARVLDVRSANGLAQLLNADGSLNEAALHQLSEYLAALRAQEPSAEEREAAEPTEPDEPTPSTTPLKDQILARLATLRPDATVDAELWLQSHGT